MTWTVVRGRYKHGVIELLEKAPDEEGLEVLILFPKPGPGERPGIWGRMKQRIAREMPDLLGMTPEERKQEFDQLSATVVGQTPYHSLEEFEAVMRGDEYGLVRH
jgi:hypothetical protein